MTTDKPSPEGQAKGQWRVVRVDTEPMTAQDYDQAVTAFASLIALWKHNQQNSQENTGENGEEDREESA